MGRIYTGLILSALWGAGCGDTTEPVATEPIERHVDGSRLKAQVISTSDGLRWFQRVYDSQRQATCLWQKAAPDGAYYCVDDGVGLVSRGGSHFSHDDEYTDAECTDPIADLFQTPGPNTFIRRSDDPCEGLQRFHSVGEPWTGAYYRRNQDGDCVREPLGHSTHYRIGPELVTGDHFVRGTLREKQSGGGIKAYVIAGEDGSETFESLQDTTHDTNCVVNRARDGKLRCLPSSEPRGWLASVSVDPTCTEPALTTFTPRACTRPRFSLMSDGDDACSPNLKVIAVGEEVTQVYAPASAVDPTCRPLTPGSREGRYYRAGAEVPATSWPEAKEIDLKAHGRLIVRGAEVAGAVKVPARLFDTQLGTECFFNPDASGTERCFPAGHGIDLKLGYFADAACTTRVSPVFPAPCTDGGYAVFVDFAQGPRLRYRAFHLGPQHEGPVYVVQSDGAQAGSCAELEGAPPASVYEVGAEIEATSLIEGTESMN
ncbi:hypothetical protein [Myxococcus sp. CA039A]|uniref:DUF7481 family protein n=1 Tax=Myxococcus sp. CA039A TaxID=2741737 RepID=UPI00157B2F20|nr:hypothetical protein [Myxococcus sp. CA039A]NTX52569.1 hypothetical protein [Myxococcus sp. CA039A]